VTRPDAQAVVGTLEDPSGAGRKNRWRSRHPHHRRRRGAFRAVAQSNPNQVISKLLDAAE
jgi:hypothetical protein